ncbi:MAG: zinc ribbon domain-containing protein [Candidatus Kapabacteria bacterium]|nr:zinc ribbon domain-containing protein [Candidatus Kapabacteria bacterium]
MPTYEYRCTTCGATFELQQSMKDNALTVCPPELCSGTSPGAGTVERLISGGGIIYKGDGFYYTDYVKKSGGGEE